MIIQKLKSSTPSVLSFNLYTSFDNFIIIHVSDISIYSQTSLLVYPKIVTINSTSLINRDVDTFTSYE